MFTYRFFDLRRTNQDLRNLPAIQTLIFKDRHSSSFPKNGEPILSSFEKTVKAFPFAFPISGFLLLKTGFYVMHDRLFPALIVKNFGFIDTK